MSLSVILHNFAANSSTHGIQQISSGEGRIKRTFWILATAGAVVALLTHLVIQVEKYFSYPVNVEMTIQHANDLEFPAITICNMSPVKKSKLQKRRKRSAETATCCCSCCQSSDSTIENSCSSCETQKCSPYSTEDIQSTSSAVIDSTTAFIPLETVGADSTTVGNEFTTTFEAPDQKPAFKEEFKLAEQLTEMISRLTLQERIDLGFTLNDMILSCTYAGSNCNPDDFVLVHNPLHGNCYIFNSGWGNKSHLTSYRTGRRYGLLMTLNINQDDYIFEAGDTAALRILIHPGHQMPFPEDQGLIIGSGVSTSVSMQKVEVERLGGVYSSCIDIDDLPDRRISNVYQEIFPETKYSQEACTRTCYQEYLIRACKCADPQYPCPNGDVNVNICNSSDQEQVECRRNVLNNFNFELILCDCPISCKETTYTSSISTGQWPADVVKNEVLGKLEDKVKFDIFGKSKFEENIAQVEIYFEEFNYKLISESPAYEVTQLLSDIGGILGLYLGMSFMSLVEHLELLIDLITYLTSTCYFKYVRKKKVIPTLTNPGNSMNMESLPRLKTGHQNSQAFQEILLRMQ